MIFKKEVVVINFKNFGILLLAMMLTLIPILVEKPVCHTVKLEPVSNIHIGKLVNLYQLAVQGVENARPMYEFKEVGYINAYPTLKIRENPNTESDVMGKLYWENKIRYTIINDDWAIIDYNSSLGYISRDYIVANKTECSIKYDVIYDRAMKSYMDFRKITDESSDQYALQLESSTADNGIRIYDNRYLIAIGNYFSPHIGQYVDVVLSNGTVLKCIVGDVKQNAHTDMQNLHGLNRDTVEFIVDTKYLAECVTTSGNVSDVCDAFKGKVIQVCMYDIYANY